jgi:hypothetical protein
MLEPHEKDVEMKHTLKSFLPHFALLLTIALIGNMVGGWLLTDPAPTEPDPTPTLMVQAVTITPLGAAGPNVSATPGFTCQGRLIGATRAANGQYDFVFTLWDAPSGGTPVAAPSSAANQSVSAGLFTVALDFGAGAFDGTARWLEIAVRASDGGSYTLLSPRHPFPLAASMTAQPTALTAMTRP